MNIIGFFFTFFLKKRDDPVCHANHFLGHYFFGNQVEKEINSKIEIIKNQYFNFSDANDIFDENVFQNLTDLFTDSGFFYGCDIVAR